MNKKTRMTSVCSLALLCAMLSGCGIWQGMKDGTVEATKSVFYTKLKILKIDLIARNGLNQNERGQSLSTVVRVYQLKDKQNYEVASYRDLLNQDKTILSNDLVEGYKQYTIRPGETISFDETLNKDTKYVGVVAFYNKVGEEQTWKMLITKKQLTNNKPVVIELVDNKVLLQETVKKVK